MSGSEPGGREWGDPVEAGWLLRRDDGGCVVHAAAVACVDRTVILLKAPRAGQVKTRLAAAIGPTAATAAYRQLVTIICQNLRDWPDVELRHAPDDAAAELRQWLASGWTLAPQGEGDLGERMRWAFAEHFAAGAQRVVMIGADCPWIQPADLTTAFAALQHSDLVLGPATDGGYWLIGLKAVQSELFRGMLWSTSSVLAETEARANRMGLAVVRLRTLSDVDTAEDWQSWSQRERPG